MGSRERRSHRVVGPALAAVPVAFLAAALVALIGAPGAGAAVDGQWWLAAYKITQANQVSTGAGVTVAVVDAGVVDTLPDLQGQVLAGKDFTGSGNAHSDPGSGCSNADHAGCYSHGTQMALLIAGTGRGLGFRGVAPGAKILPVKVGATTSDTNDFSSATIAQGIDYAVSAGAKIISVSLGSSGECDSDEGAAVKNAYLKGVIVVASTGNDGGAVSSPADCPGALAIAGSDENADHWSKSNSGPDVVLAAPYGGVQESLSQKPLTGAHGTSDSAALAAGYFALLKSKYPTDSWRQTVSRAIWHTETNVGTKVGTRQDDFIGYGVMLPYNELTRSTPATLANPVYTKFQQELATSSTPPTSTPPASSPSTSTPTATSGGSASTPAATAPTGSDSGSSTGLIVALIAVVLVVLVVVIVLIARARRPKVAAGPPPGPGWPPQQPPQQPPPSNGRNWQPPGA